MTKRPAQPTSRIAKMRVASAEQKPSTVDKVRVDPRVAALVVQTYEALSPKNRKLFAQLPTKQMVATAMKLQAAKAKPAKLQKKADAGNGVVYFVIHIDDNTIEYDRDSDDAEERARYDEFLDEDKDLTSAARGAELAMLRYMEAIVRKVLPGTNIGNEGHDTYDDLVCKFSVNSTEDLLKVKDAIERKFGSEGTIHSQLDSYTEATQFNFAPWDQKGPTEGLIPFSDLDEWLEDQQAKTARKASAKGKKSAGVKKKAGPGAGRTFVFTGDDRQFITPKPSIGSCAVSADVMADAILRGMKGTAATLDIHCDVEDLAVVSYDKVADASDAGFISRITISASDLAEAASELTKYRDAADGPVTKAELVDAMEGDVEVDIMFNRNVTYGGGWTTPATPDIVEFDADIAECILHFKARTVRDVNAGIESGVFTLSEDMAYTFESLEFDDDDDDDDFMAEDEDLHQARMARAAKSKKSARTKKTASLKWDDKGQNVWVAENVEVRLSTYSGKPRSMRVHLRIDGRRGNEFRVDKGAMTGWEAIDEGPTRAPKTLEDAKALAERWVTAANEQGTLSPSDYKSAKVKATAATKPKVKRAGDLFGRINRGFADCIASNVFMDVMEEHGGSGYEVAAKDDLLRKCSAFLQDLYPAAELEADCEAFMATDPHVSSQHFGSAEEMYGWYLCMQTLGHGVGLYDYGYKTKLKKQYMEVVGYMTNLDDKYGTADILIDYPLDLQGCEVETIRRQDVEKFTDDAVASDDD